MQNTVPSPCPGPHRTAGPAGGQQRGEGQRSLALRFQLWAGLLLLGYFDQGTFNPFCASFPSGEGQIVWKREEGGRERRERERWREREMGEKEKEGDRERKRQRLISDAPGIKGLKVHFCRKSTCSLTRWNKVHRENKFIYDDHAVGECGRARRGSHNSPLPKMWM